MCGIAGKISFIQRVEDEELRTFGDLMKDRGPENLGVWTKENIGLVHTRLSIIDLKEEANQPMHVEGKLSMSYNGEIYNYRDLRKELEPYITFKTTSDTEVILNGYQVWGIDKLLKKLDGMFAIALIDHEKQQLFLARDRFGKKPLYYYQDAQKFIFSSDIRVIHHSEKQNLSLNFNSIDYYLTELSSPQPATIWEEVNQVQGGNLLTFSLVTKESNEHPFWSGINPNQKQNVSLQEAIDQTEESLLKAIEKRLVADVPIGCFLSGGVDSGLIASMLASHTTERIKTYSFGLSYEQMNELPDAKIVADRYDTDHTEIVVEVDAMSILPDLVEYMGEPFADSSIIPSYYVTNEISKYVKVALSGDGGDELFGGYNEYGIAYRTDDFLNKYPNGMVQEINVLFDKVYSRFSGKKENNGSYLHYVKKDGAEKLFRDMGYSFKDIHSIYGEKYPSTSKGHAKQVLQSVWDKQIGENLTDKLLIGSLKTRLLNDYLVKVDRSSMKNSLEVRSPFLDRELAEMAFQLPNKHKFYGNINKYLLKKLAEKYVDPNIWNRPKRGFGIPIGDWLQNEMFSFMKETILDGYFVSNGLFSRSFLEEEIKEHQLGNHKTHKLWAVMCLEIWANKFLIN